MRQFAGPFCMFFSAVMAVAAVAQPVELKPLDILAPSDRSSVYRSYSALDAEQARERVRLREEARRTVWVEEADRIRRSGGKAVRDDDELYIYLDAPSLPRAVVLRSLWTVDPGAIYSYESYDDVTGFHIVRESGNDDAAFLFISAKTGLVYKGTGVQSPVQSPGKSRFFLSGLGGMACGEGVTVYRFQSDKVFREAQSSMGCEQCTHAWVGNDEIRSACKDIPNQNSIEYRLMHREGVWHSTRTPAAR